MDVMDLDPASARVAQDYLETGDAGKTSSNLNIHRRTVVKHLLSCGFVQDVSRYTLKPGLQAEDIVGDTGHMVRKEYLISELVFKGRMLKDVLNETGLSRDKLLRIMTSIGIVQKKTYRYIHPDLEGLRKGIKLALNPKNPLPEYDYDPKAIRFMMKHFGDNFVMVLSILHKRMQEKRVFSMRILESDLHDLGILLTPYGKVAIRELVGSAEYDVERRASGMVFFPKGYQSPEI